MNPATGLRPPTELELEKALMYFHAYMYGPLQGKLRLYGARGINAARAKTMASDWEVFASILVGDLGRKLAVGIDLHNYEVKSAADEGSYEYQYHREGGREKLLSDMGAGHLFFAHKHELRLVNLWYASGAAMVPHFFERWLKGFPDPYPKNGRYRKAVPLSWVKENATLLMTLEDGEVSFPKPAGRG